MRSKLFSSPTTRTNLNTQIQVLQHRILKKAHKNLSTNISNMAYSNRLKEKPAQH